MSQVPNDSRVCDTKLRHVAKTSLLWLRFLSQFLPGQHRIAPVGTAVFQRLVVVEVHMASQGDGFAHHGPRHGAAAAPSTESNIRLRSINDPRQLSVSGD